MDGWKRRSVLLLLLCMFGAILFFRIEALERVRDTRFGHLVSQRSLLPSSGTILFGVEHGKQTTRRHHRSAASKMSLPPGLAGLCMGRLHYILDRNNMESPLFFLLVARTVGRDTISLEGKETERAEPPIADITCSTPKPCF